jgi:hypothetical protein
VTNPDGQSNASQLNFTYVAPAPTISAVTPTSGSTAGGTIVTINGSNFVSGASVIVGGTAATSATFVSSSSIRITTPAHAAGQVVLTVTNPDGQSAQTSSFSYAVASKPGDANNDGRVNAIDLSILVSYDGQNYPPADFNGDGSIGSADLAILLANWTW